MMVIGKPSADYTHAMARLPASTSPLFRDQMFYALWEAATFYALDPVGLVAQSLKETGNGNFGGQVTPQYYNTCGLKVRHIGKYPGVDDADNPLAHAQFADWEVGATAHAQHVRAYLNWPVPDMVLSPRYVWVIEHHNLSHWHEFGGYDSAGRIKWAPSETYGQEVEAIMRRLQGA